MNTTGDPNQPKTFDDGNHTLDTEKCENCQHFRKLKKTGGGFCHRMPPQIVSDRGGEGIGIISMWPQVDDNDSCGEFQFNENASPV